MCASILIRRRPPTGRPWASGRSWWPRPGGCGCCTPSTVRSTSSTPSRIPAPAICCANGPMACSPSWVGPTTSFSSAACSSPPGDRGCAGGGSGGAGGGGLWCPLQRLWSGADGGFATPSRHGCGSGAATIATPLPGRHGIPGAEGPDPGGGDSSGASGKPLRRELARRHALA